MPSRLSGKRFFSLLRSTNCSCKVLPPSTPFIPLTRRDAAFVCKGKPGMCTESAANTYGTSGKLPPVTVRGVLSKADACHWDCIPNLYCGISGLKSFILKIKIEALIWNLEYDSASQIRLLRGGNTRRRHIGNNNWTEQIVGIFLCPAFFHWIIHRRVVSICQIRSSQVCCHQERCRQICGSPHVAPLSASLSGAVLSRRIEQP